jgi:hypothetical protein
MAGRDRVSVAQLCGEQAQVCDTKTEAALSNPEVGQPTFVSNSSRQKCQSSEKAQRLFIS